MNKEKLLLHLNFEEEDQKEELRKLIDLCDQSSRQHVVKVSGFLSPIFRAFIPSIMSHYQDLSYEMDGGYDDCEYFKLMVYPDYLDLSHRPIKALRVVYNPKYGDIGHRDVLGSLMGLGIQRHLIGDILVKDALIHIIVDEDMGPYICGQLERIGSTKVSCEIIDTKEVEYTKPEMKDEFYTLSSLRLDAFIASVHNMSRNKALQLIKSDKVKVNYLITSNPSLPLKEKDMISLRGKGRVIFTEFLGTSKKDRIKIAIKKYV